MNKIIGFVIKQQADEPEVNFFNKDIHLSLIKHKAWNIFIWGVGKLEECVVNGAYTLSFPLHDSLLDRNVLLRIGDSIEIENDWLGSIPVYYNKKAKIISTLPNLCIKDKAIHKEGLSNFCEFGYSVFEQTMFENVKFMRFYSKLILSDNQIKVEHKIDPVLDASFTSKQTETSDVISLMKRYISEIESQVEGDIVLPTSGGYDSRILNYLIEDKSRIKSFTYGVSKKQSKSNEVVYAKKISQIYNTEWQQIELGGYHKYIGKWFNIYGISTHLHGMYHLEFYEKLLNSNSFNNATFLSGIVGDAWAGSIDYKDIKSHSDLIELGYTHGMNLDLSCLQFETSSELKKKVFEAGVPYFSNNKLKAIYTIRMKLILISYLTQIPEYYGMPVWTPFLNFEIVKSTLNLSEQQRKNRVWQKSLFEKVGLNIEDMNLNSISSNKLDYEVAKKTKFEPLDVSVLSLYVTEDKLININKLITKGSVLETIKNELLYIPKVSRVLRIFGFKNNVLKAIYEYYVLKTLEKALKYEP